MVNLRDRRAAQAKRHADELHAAKLQAHQAEQRLLALIQGDQYQAGFRDGTTVTIDQLSKWLADSRKKAQGIIADLGDHTNPDWKRGHDFAAEWIDHAIAKLTTEVAIRVAQRGTE